MVTRTLALAAAATLVLSASAWAAKSGSYSGVSVNKEIYGYGVLEPKTDKGKVTFQGKSNAVTKFKLNGQQFMCGPSPDRRSGLGREDQARLRRQGQGHVHGRQCRTVHRQDHGAQQRQGLRHHHAHRPLRRRRDVLRQD